MRRPYLIAAIAAILAAFIFAFALRAEAASTAVTVFNGGTGTSSLPAYGQLLIGGKNGEYELVASSTLGGASTGAVNSVFGRTGFVVAQNGDYNTSQVAESSNLYFTPTRAISALTGQNVSIFTNNAGYLTSLAGAASSTLLGDANAFSGVDTFTNGLSNFAGTWQGFSPSHFQTALTLPLSTSNGGTGASSLTGLITTADLATANISQFTNNSGYLTSLAGAASSTLLGDANTFSGVDKFTNASSDFTGTWQTHSPSFFQTALGFTPVPNTRNVLTTYPLQGGGALSADLTLTTAFSTTTANSFNQLQQFNNNASTTQLSISGNLWTAITTCNGGNALQTTSGLVGCGWTFSTTSASYFLSQSQGAAFSTTSAAYWQSQTNFFSTTSAAYWQSVNNFFSTTSASYFLAQNTGPAFSTTSASYFLSQNQGPAFSTTSAALFLSLNTGNAFSTTSAAYWKTQTTFTGASSTLLADSSTFTGKNVFANASSTLFTAPTAWINSLTLTSVTGSTQCLHVNSAGFVSGTGSDCGTGSGGVTGLAATYPLLTTGSTGSITISTAFSTTTLNAWSQLQTFTGGIVSQASSTITGNVTLATTTTGSLNSTIVVSGWPYAQSGAGIQQAINVCSGLGTAKCGKVFLDTGTYTANAMVAIPSNITLQCADRYNTVIVGNYGGPTIGTTQSGTLPNVYANIAVDNCGVESNQNDIMSFNNVNTLYLTNDFLQFVSPFPTFAAEAMLMQYDKNVTVSGNYLYNLYGDGIQFNAVQNFTATANSVASTSDDAFDVDSDFLNTSSIPSLNGVLSGNQISGSASNDLRIEDSSNITATGNQFSNAGINCVIVDSSTIGGTGIVVDGNQMKNCTVSGVTVSGSMIGTNVNGNGITTAALSGGGNVRGGIVINAASTTADTNTIFDTDNNGNAAAIIFYQVTADDSTAQGNSIASSSVGFSLWNGNGTTVYGGITVKDNSIAGSVATPYSGFSNQSGVFESGVVFNAARTIGFYGISTTTPGSILSVGSVVNFSAATSSFYGSGGINLAAGCFSVAGNCLSLTNLGGLVPIANGGTDQSSQTTNGVNYFDGAHITSGAGLVFDGTNLAISTTTLSGNVLLANGNVSVYGGNAFRFIRSSDNGVLPALAYDNSGTITVGGNNLGTLNLANTNGTVINITRSGATNFVGIATSSGGTAFSIGNGASSAGINFSLATSTFSNAGGINLTTGCFSINNTCVGGSGGSGVTGGTNGMLAAWTGATTLTATSGPTFAFFDATSSGATSTITGPLQMGTTTGNANFVLNGTISYGPNILQVATSTNQNIFDIANSGNIGISTSTPWAKLAVVGAIVVAEASSTPANGAASVSINFQAQLQTTVEMTHNLTVNLNNDTLPGETQRVILCQDGTGSRTVTWASTSTLIWPAHTTPTQTATAFECDIYSFLVTGATGTVRTLGAVNQAF